MIKRTDMLIIYTGAANVIALSITFFIGVIIARYYGPEGKGLVALLLLLPTLIVGITGLSSGEGVLYYIGKNKIDGSNFGTLLVQLSIVFIPISILIYLVIPYLTDKYPYSTASQISLLALLFLSEIHKFSLKATMQFKLYNLITLAESLFILLTLIALIYLALQQNLWVDMGSGNAPKVWYSAISAA